MPNQLALKMDGAQASHPHRIVGVSGEHRQVGRRVGREAAAGASPGETDVGADLGCTGKYSNESFED